MIPEPIIEEAESICSSPERRVKMLGERQAPSDAHPQCPNTSAEYNTQSDTSESATDLEEEVVKPRDPEVKDARGCATEKSHCSSAPP